MVQIKTIFPKTIFALSGLIFLFSHTQAVFANEITKVQLKVQDKITANADFYPGVPDKANILILHGFLLNHNFHTVKRLAESLHESGFTVLTPSLSLGINKRVKSLPCEAIHTHSLEQDIAEVDLWVNWLRKKPNEKIILIGHSTGSLHLISYLVNHEASDLKQIIFLSIPDFGPTSFTYETEAFADKARKLVANNNNSLQEFGLSYCQKYTTPAKNYLSYYQLSKEKILKNLKAISIDKTLIFGTLDKRIDKDWNQQLDQLNMEVIAIESANHFFDYEHEFDLLDNIETILRRTD